MSPISQKKVVKCGNNSLLNNFSLGSHDLWSKYNKIFNKKLQLLCKLHDVGFHYVHKSQPDVKGLGLLPDPLIKRDRFMQFPQIQAVMLNSKTESLMDHFTKASMTRLVSYSLFLKYSALQHNWKRSIIIQPLMWKETIVSWPVAAVKSALCGPVGTTDLQKVLHSHFTLHVLSTGPNVLLVYFYVFAMSSVNDT